MVLFYKKNMLRVFFHRCQSCVVTTSFHPGQIVGKVHELKMITKRSIDPSIQVVHNSLIATKHLKMGEELSKPFDTTNEGQKVKVKMNGDDAQKFSQMEPEQQSTRPTEPPNPTERVRLKSGSHLTLIVS